MFGNFLLFGPIVVEKIVVALSSIAKEKALGAQEHLELTRFVTLLFGKSMNNTVALIGDNCSTNKTFAMMLGCVSIGCASCRWNVAVRDIL